MNTKKISPCIWCNSDALEAAQLYTAAFAGGKIEHVTHYVTDSPWPASLPAGAPLTVRFTLCGLEFLTLNGGPVFRPTPALSFFVDCESTAQMDALWQALAPGGQVLMEPGEYPFSPKFGWLADKYGVSWQLSASGKPQAITPYLLFTKHAHGSAEQAMQHYLSIFEDAAILDIQRYGKDMPEPEGTVMHATFRLAGQPLMAADSPSQPHGFGFTEGVSLCMYCQNQAEIDALWGALTAEGEEQPCGWLKDKFGVSWQIIPHNNEMLTDDDNPDRARRVSNLLLTMKKIDMKALEDAYYA